MKLKVGVSNQVGREVGELSGRTNVKLQEEESRNSGILKKTLFWKCSKRDRNFSPWTLQVPYSVNDAASLVRLPHGIAPLPKTSSPHS